MIRRLKIKTLDVQYELVYGKLRAVIFWDVQGCHRIKIKAYSLAFPGHLKAVSLKTEGATQAVKIQFIGVFNKEERIVPVHLYAGLSHSFFALPTHFSVFLDPGKLGVKSGGLFTLAITHGSAKLSNEYSYRNIHTAFFNYSIHPEISPSPEVFLLIHKTNKLISNET
jgi:hypothetical protein